MCTLFLEYISHVICIFLCQCPLVCVSWLFFEQSAEKQGNQLHMNVYKMKGQACGGPLKTEVKELKGDLRPAPPYPSRVKTVDKGTQVTPEREAVRNKWILLVLFHILPLLLHILYIFLHML